MSKETDSKSSADIVIAALNEEEGIGLTLTEISQNTSPNQFWWSMGAALTAQLKLPKIWVHEFCFRMVQEKATLSRKL